ncbi:MAG: SAM-dependent methyltransferase [Pelagibaca sp.]|nr:SAM-dependent methyltransferase [Pelagibaca sp.]
MAFDQSTRNRLQKFVSNARAILGEEFTRQLQATYGLDPKQGTVAAIDSLTHLDNRQRQTAHLLRETLVHYLATTPGKGEKDRTKQVLDRIVREQAFTVLNRLAALRMAEARGFLLESIAKAHSSKGFQLYRQLSGTAHGETGDAYRNYLVSLFDEFSLDLAVLFDRHSAQGRLFPRETALLELLAEINHHEIEHLWAEDETIGWIYQYFNSQEERKKMRAESQAPRNSRELAVRNQFFTPRYVVEFLTDNTLGRIWYEMTQGNTALVDSCRYLVRRPTEIFLKPGETAPEIEASDSEALSQEELLKQPVYIPHRPLKDPRSIRMLDPACGSMHFGLYAFDLFERIYLEAWQLEQQLGPDAFTREAGQQALQSTFDSLEAIKQQIPKLIIEHNIHGVDIDPRAVQIAGLSLWQRAQRAWHQQGIKPQQRPTIVKSNIVCAEPMPGENALLQEFTSKLNPPVLGQLLEVIFDKMQLAGEAGTLLKIEEEIQTAIHEAREQWLKQSGSNSVGDMFQAELDAATPQAKLGFDLRGIDDATFWDDAEQRILQALSDYAEQAESNSDQKRLFAEDAAKGFAFIDLCRKRFDVVAMNPPFSETVGQLQSYLKNNYPNNWTNTYASFIERSSELSIGQFGFICPQALLAGYRMAKLREFLVASRKLQIYSELGNKIFEDMGLSTISAVCGRSADYEPLLIDLNELEMSNWTLVEKSKVTERTNFILSKEIIRADHSDWDFDLAPIKRTRSFSCCYSLVFHW